MSYSSCKALYVQMSPEDRLLAHNLLQIIVDGDEITSRLRTFLDGAKRYKILSKRNITASEIEARCNPAPTLATLPVVEQYEIRKVAPVQQEQEKENTMCYEISKTLDQTQLTYFKGRLSYIFCEKDRELRVTFGLTDDESPHTAEELIARITAGKYVLRDDDRNYYSKLDRFIWRDPAVKKDQAGYEMASKSLSDTFELLKDAIVAAPADGAKQVAALQAWTYTTPATA